MTTHHFHYIYKTTCTVTGKFYIGMHSTSNLEDDYIGSGKRLWLSIRKYGIENHSREILEFLHSREELKRREAEIVNEEMLKDSQCMNLKRGGEGGWENIHNDSWRKIIKEKNSRKQGGIGNSQYGKIWVFNDNLQVSKRIFPEEIEVDWHFGRKMYGKIGEQMKEKLSSSLQKEKNWNFGRKWMFNDLEKKCQKVHSSDFQNFEEAGWIFGRKMNYEKIKT